LNTATLERKLIRELDVRLAPAGFRRVRISHFYGDPYTREMPNGRQTLGIGTRPYLDALEAEVANVNVRFNPVEDLVAKFEDAHPLIRPDSIAARSTLTAQISSSDPKPGDPLYLWGGENRKVWLIHAVDEVPEIGSQMAAYAKEKAEPILAQLSNMEHALSLLSGDDQRSRSYSGPDEHRAKQAIALAFLLRGEGAAKHLAKSKLDRLKRQDRPALEKWIGRFFEEYKGKPA
jgi:hypothetical protein